MRSRGWSTGDGGRDGKRPGSGGIGRRRRVVDANQGGPYGSAVPASGPASRGAWQRVNDEADGVGVVLQGGLPHHAPPTSGAADWTGHGLRVHAAAAARGFYQGAP